MRAARSLRCVVLWAAIVSASGCAGGGSSPNALTVGSAKISTATVEHWMRALAPQRKVPVPPDYSACVAEEGSAQACASRYERLKQEALSFLISGRWLLAEAQRRNLPAVGSKVRARLRAEARSYASLEDLRQALAATGRTIPDRELEIQGKLAAQEIRASVLGGSMTTDAEVAAYYERHRRDYHVDEQRFFDIVESLHSRVMAERLKARILHRTVDIADGSLHEVLYRPDFAHFPGIKKIIEKAIFKAKLGVVTAPVKVESQWFLVEVTRIVPAFSRPLGEVRAAIRRKLEADRARRLLAVFTIAWDRRWRAVTDCSRSYVVEKCRQHTPPSKPESPWAEN